MERVAIIGAGHIGKAIAHLIQTHADVHVWDENPLQVSEQMESLEEVMRGASIVFICVPSWAIRAVAAHVSPVLDRDAVIVSLAKGIEQESLKTVDVVLKEAFPTGQKISILGGPLLADEVVSDLPGIGVLASDDPIVFDRVSPLFVGTAVRVERAADVRTVAVASVLKNVYALGLGIADGLGWGWNGKGWLASRSIQEMIRIVQIVGGDVACIAGPAGVGDFIATGMSPSSHNHRAGFEIARTGVATTSNEGCRSLPLVSNMLTEHLADLPIVQALNRVVTKGESAKTVFSKLLTSG